MFFCVFFSIYLFLAIYLFILIFLDKKCDQDFSLLIYKFTNYILWQLILLFYFIYLFYFILFFFFFLVSGNIASFTSDPALYITVHLFASSPTYDSTGTKFYYTCSSGRLRGVQCHRARTISFDMLIYECVTDIPPLYWQTLWWRPRCSATCRLYWIFTFSVFCFFKS